MANKKFLRITLSYCSLSLFVTASLISRTTAVFAWTFICTGSMSPLATWSSSKLCRCVKIIITFLSDGSPVNKLLDWYLSASGALLRFAAAWDTAHERRGLSRAHLLWRSISRRAAREPRVLNLTSARLDSDVCINICGRQQWVFSQPSAHTRVSVNILNLYATDPMFFNRYVEMVFNINQSEDLIS